MNSNQRGKVRKITFDTFEDAVAAVKDWNINVPLRPSDDISIGKVKRSSPDQKSKGDYK